MLLLVRAGSPEPVTVNAVFQCGPTRVHTRFAGDYLRISMDGRDYDLSRAISASGARYLGRANEEPISFWNKGHQATLSIGDRTYPQCNQIVDEDEAAKLPHKERSEEHTSELQSLMRISYAVFCLKKKKKKIHSTIETTQ